jgi:membrane-bound lytic murein transglycosylase D
MRTRAAIFLSALGASVVSGCVPAGLQFSLFKETPTPQPVFPTPASATSLQQSVLTPAILALTRSQDRQEENVFAPIVIPAPTEFELQVVTADPKPERTESAPKVIAERTQSTVSQRLTAQISDDPLLDLLQKDLDRAVQQPPERRRLEFSKSVRENFKVRYYLNQFSKGGKNDFQQTLARSGKYMPMIGNVLREEGLPEELGYLALIESGFIVDRSSPTGAVGIWQLIPATGRRYGLRIDSWIDERRDPVKSTRTAAAYLKDLHRYFGRWYLVTAAYNAGEGAVDRAMQISGEKDFWKLRETTKLRDETRNFVPKFVAAAIIAADPKKYGFASVPYHTPIEYEEIEVYESKTLGALAAMTNITSGTLQELNPELLKGQTPPGTMFRLKIPLREETIVASASDRSVSDRRKDPEPMQVVTHRVEKGDTLYSIAHRYGQNVRSVMELNGLSTYTISVGQPLKILIETVRGAMR